MAAVVRVLTKGKDGAETDEAKARARAKAKAKDPLGKAATQDHRLA